MHQSSCDAALVTQMRAGTHYMCAALRIGLEATIHRPDSEKRFVVIDEGYIRKGLHETDDFAFPRARSRVFRCVFRCGHGVATVATARRRSAPRVPSSLSRSSALYGNAGVSACFSPFTA